MASYYIQLPEGTTGPAGPTGPAGATGPAGPGVATGGTTGQILAKTSNTDYATGWIDNKVGDVVGPASAVDSALALFDGTTGKLLKSGAAGAQANVLRWLSGVPTWTNELNPTNLAMFYEDFLSPTAAFIGSASGSGGAVSGPRASASDAAHPGAYRLETGTDTNGFGNISSSNIDNAIKLGGGIATFESVVNLSALSNGTDTYAAAIGLASNAFQNTLPAADGIYLYADSNASANWRIRCQASSVTTDRDTGVPIATGWTKVAWILNSAGTSVQAYINGVAAGAPVTTNIPTAALLFQGIIVKSAGTTSVKFDLDYLKFTIALTIPR